MARITVWLFIESTNLTVEEMTALIGVTPDKSWRIGDSRGRTGKTYETNSWSLESVLETDENPMNVGKMLQLCLDDVLVRIAGHSDRFKNVASGRTAGLYLGISADEPPTLGVKAATINAVSALAVDVEIDLML